MKYNTVGKRKNKRRSQRYRKTRRRRRKNRRRRTKFQKGSNKTHRRRRKQRKGGRSDCQPIRAQPEAIWQVFKQIWTTPPGAPGPQTSVEATLDAFYRIGEGDNITAQSLGEMMSRDEGHTDADGDSLMTFDTFSKIIEGRCRTHRPHTWHMLFRKIAAITPGVKQDSDGEWVMCAPAAAPAAAAPVGSLFAALAPAAAAPVWRFGVDAPAAVSSWFPNHRP